jgi:hypothetical protein
VISTKSQILSASFRTQRRGDVEPPSGAECATVSPQAWQTTVAADQDAVESTRWSRRGPGRGGVDADVVYADEGIAESVELKPREVDDVEDKVVEVFFSKLSI